MNIIRLSGIGILLTAVAFVNVEAADGIRTEISVFQDNLAASGQTMLFRDTADFVEGIPVSAFLFGMSTEIDPVEVDSVKAVLLVHVVTLGPPSNTYSRRFNVEYELPARLDGIEGKPGARYSLQVRPLGRIEIDTSDCSFDHRQKGVFAFDPSAHMDIYYVPNSLGDFYWSAVKGMLEDGYRQFQTRFNLNLPGKYLVYLCPCMTHTVLWDERFAMAVNPSASTAFAVFNKSTNAVDAYLVNYAAALRRYGYAPALLAEGMAGYFSSPIFDMKQIVGEKRNVPLEQLVKTTTFIALDPHVSDRTAASFTRYLIDQYGDEKFFTVYKASHDLNLPEQLESAYGKTIKSLETEWLHYVDTFRLDVNYVALLAEKAEASMDYGLMSTYAQGMLDLSKDTRDSLRSLGKMERAAFFTGDYYRATEIQDVSLLLENDARGWMAMATYKMMNGLYDEARADLEKGLSMNSSNQFIKFNLALCHQIQGDEDEARKLWTDIIVNPIDESAQAESRILLGHLLLESGDKDDRAQAITYFKEAAGMFEQTIRAHNASPSTEMWTGICYVGLGDTESAYNRLSTAAFLETRAYHLGLIYLWLGKVADLLGQRETAREYFGEVIALPSAVYHQDEARKYLDKAYTQKH